MAANANRNNNNANNNAGNNNAGNNNNNNNNNNNSLSNDHVEFSVKAEEDLYLHGAEATIRRVTAETNYSCLMLKTQRFSSLFRHYAKYHGLRKDDLEYYFVNVLENEDTPETVQLQRGDTIMVRKRRPPPVPPAASDDDDFFESLLQLLDNQHDHCDTILHMTVDGGQVKAHKALLSARTEYFKQTLRTCNGSGVTVPEPYTTRIVQAALEFLYTNRLDNDTASTLSTDEWILLLQLADEWKLRDLKRWTELVLLSSAHLHCATVAQLYGVTERVEAPKLNHACVEFIMSHARTLTANPEFLTAMEAFPKLCIPLLKMAAKYYTPAATAGSHKKQRTDAGTPASAASPSSANVPDMDL